MTRPQALLLACALLVALPLAGCADERTPKAAGRDGSSAAAPAATGTSPAATSGAASRAVQESAAVEPAPENGADASLERLTRLAAQDQLPGGRWKAGQHYKPLVPSQPTSVAGGKVEVVEVFWYGCPHCDTLDPFLETWRKNKPANVEFVRVPVTWSPGHMLHARLYYTLEALDRDDLHPKVFDTVHRGGNMLIGNDEASTLRMQLAWARSQGVDEKAFTDAWQSMTVTTRLQQASDLIRRYKVEGVPLIVVNGKYTTDVGSAGGHTQLLALINDLATAEKRR